MDLGIRREFWLNHFICNEASELATHRYEHRQNDLYGATRAVDERNVFVSQVGNNTRQSHGDWHETCSKRIQNSKNPPPDFRRRAELQNCDDAVVDETVDKTAHEQEYHCRLRSGEGSECSRTC